MRIKKRNSNGENEEREKTDSNQKIKTKEGKRDIGGNWKTNSGRRRSKKRSRKSRRGEVMERKK